MTLLISILIGIQLILTASVLAAKRGGHHVVSIRQSNNLDQKSKGKTREGVNDVLTQGLFVFLVIKS